MIQPQEHRPSDRWRAARWLSAGFLAAATLLFAAGREADRHERHRLNAFRAQTADLARISEAIIEGKLRSLDEALLVLRDAYTADPRQFTGHLRLMRSGPLADRELFVVLVDRDGFLVFTDTPNATPRMYLGDREYFRFFADGGEDSLYIDEPRLGRVTGRNTLPVVRPLYDKRGGFLGVIAISLPQQTLINFTPRLHLSGETTISIVNHSGSMVSLSPDPAETQAKTLPPELLAPLLRGTEGVYSSRAAPDRAERIVAYRHVHSARTPLIVFVESLPAEVLAETSLQRSILMGGAGFTSLVIMVLIALYLKGHRTTARLIETLRTSKRLEYETLTRTSLDGFLIIDGSGRFLDTNDTFCAWLGHPREELLRLSVADIEALESPDQIAAHMRTVIESGSDRFQSRWRRKDGTIFDVEISAQHLQEAGERLFVFVRDVTERKRAEEALLRSERLLAETEKMGNVGGWEVNIDTGRQIWTEGIYRIHEVDPSFEPTVENGIGFYSPASRVIIEEAVRRAVAQGEPFDVELEITTAKGNHRTVHAIGKADLEHRRVYGFFQDVTERSRLAEEKTRLEDQLRQSQKVEAIGRLAGGVAHDFNNLTAIILGYGEMLLEQLPPEDPRRRHAEQIVAAGQRSTALTRQLLAFSRKQTLQPEVLDLNVLLRNFEQMLGRLIGEDIELKFRLDAHPGRVKADPGQLEQVITNLALNARDAMPLGGALTIETADVELDKMYAARHESVVPGPYVMLALTDTGCGMDKPTMTRLFEPFFTTKPKGKGTGLGMATVYGIVKQSGGYIWGYSEPGHGTTFKIYLPRTEAQAAAKVGGSGEDAPRGSGELVLLVEDESSLRELCESLLVRLGYRVSAAGSGPEALALVKEQKPGPDLLLTDVIMPGMSGAELAERLGRERPGLKVLYMSGYPNEAIAPHGVLDPGTLFIQKPFSERALAAKVQKALKGNKPAAAPPGRRILMIDDDEQYRDLVRHFCTKHGYLFTGVDSEAGALAALAGANFDVLLVDLNIPGTDGERVLREIRAAGHAAPAIVLTGDVSGADTAALQPLGVVRTVEKSGSTKPLLAAIEDVAARTAPRRETDAPRSASGEPSR